MAAYRTGRKPKNNVGYCIRMLYDPAIGYVKTPSLFDVACV